LRLCFCLTELRCCSTKLANLIKLLLQTIKKNWHRAGRKKRERIQRVQHRIQQAAAELVAPIIPPRQVASIQPRVREPLPQAIPFPLPRDPPAQEIPLVDLTSEDTIPYVGLNDHIEVIDLEPTVQADLVEENLLEPLDPDIEYRHNIHRIFITLEEYARNAFDNHLDC